MEISTTKRKMFIFTAKENGRVMKKIHRLTNKGWKEIAGYHPNENEKYEETEQFFAELIKKTIWQK